MNKLGLQLDHKLLAHIQGALDYSPAAIIIAAAPSGEILYVNEAVRKFRGHTDSPLTGIQLEQYMMSWKEFDANGRQLSSEEMPLGVAISQGRAVDNQEIIVELDDGSRKWALASAAPIFDDDGEIIAGSVIWYDITERKQLEAKLKQEADFDCLTGVFSRHRFMESAERILERFQRDYQSMSVLMFDLDYFKDVNDYYGHAAGDEVLRSFAGIIKRGVRPSDIIGRVGGEEFVLILQGADLDIGTRIGEKLRSEVERSAITTDTGEVSITTSIGVSSPGILQQQIGHFPSLDELLANADAALYEAKHKGRNRVETTLACF
ncbi:MAG: hypothetical protein CMI09_10565 [Oceanospirillaceae bacterium]|nr:hypothetical protein [Oceanospirillaceae bacterium]